MNIFIAGGGRVGFHLARLLSAENHDVTVIESDRSVLEHIDYALDVSTSAVTALAEIQMQCSGVGEDDVFLVDRFRRERGEEPTQLGRAIEESFIAGLTEDELGAERGFFNALTTVAPTAATTTLPPRTLSYVEALAAPRAPALGPGWLISLLKRGSSPSRRRNTVSPPAVPVANCSPGAGGASGSKGPGTHPGQSGPSMLRSRVKSFRRTSPRSRIVTSGFVPLPIMVIAPCTPKNSARFDAVYPK